LEKYEAMANIYVLNGPANDRVFAFYKGAFVKSGVVSKLKKTKNHGKPPFCLDVVKQVIETKRPFAVSNVETEEQNVLVDTLKVLKIQSVMCVPLLRRSRFLG